MKTFLPHSYQHEFKETIQVQRLSPTATIPCQGTSGSAGFDVTMKQAIKIEPGEISKIPTGLSTTLPQDMYIRVAPQSSLALKHLTVQGGVIDSYYRGIAKK